MQTPNHKTEMFVALDVGERRVGVAIANSVARISRPLETLTRGETFWDVLGALLRRESASMVVVGLPRNLEGDDTPQTVAVRAFAKELEQRFSLPVSLQDEALTSVQAEAELKSRGKQFAKGDIDALAAAYILEDYLHGLQS